MGSRLPATHEGRRLEGNRPRPARTAVLAGAAPAAPRRGSRAGVPLWTGLILKSETQKGPSPKWETGPLVLP